MPRVRHAPVLVACLDPTSGPDRIDAAVAGHDFAGFLHTAQVHRVTSLLHRPLGEHADVPPAVRNAIGAARHHAIAHHMQTVADLDRAGAVLASADVPCVVMKGPVLAETVYGLSDARSYADLDLLVAPSLFGVALGALEAAGAVLRDRNWPMINDTQRGQLSLVLPRGTLLDLHWSWFNEPERRADFPVRSQDVLDRSVDVGLGGPADGAIRMHDPVDAVLHLCAHALLSGGDRLVWLSDISRQLRACPAHWDDLVDRARATRLNLVVAVMLDRVTRHFVGTVPTEVVAALSGRSAWRLSMRALVRRPIPERDDELLTGRTFVAVTRGSDLETARALGRSVVVEVRDRLLREPEHPWRAKVAGRARGLPVEPSMGQLDLWESHDEHAERSMYLSKIAQHGEIW